VGVEIDHAPFFHGARKYASGQRFHRIPEHMYNADLVTRASCRIDFLDARFLASEVAVVHELHAFA